MSENYFNLSKIPPINFYGDTRLLYDLVFEPHTWVLLEFNKRNKTNSPPKYKGKGHIIGLNVWNMLEMVMYDDEIKNIYLKYY